MFATTAAAGRRAGHSAAVMPVAGLAQARVMRQHVFRLIAVIMRAGCESASSPPTPSRVTFTDLDAWSGGTLLATTSWSPAQSLPVVLVSGDTAAVHAVDDSTIDITAEKFPGPIMKLAVVRRATLRVETVIPVTPLPGCPDTDRLITSTAERRLYWLRTWLWPSPVHPCVTTFDLMP
jgi:hypothetical protein